LPPRKKSEISHQKYPYIQKPINKEPIRDFSNSKNRGDRKEKKIKREREPVKEKNIGWVLSLNCHGLVAEKWGC